MNNYKLIIIIFIDSLTDIPVFRTDNLYYLYFFNERAVETFELKFKINNVIILSLIGNVSVIVIILIVLYL